MPAADARGVALHVAQQRAPRLGQLAVPLEHHPPLQEVGGRVDQHALRFEAVAAGPPGLLLVVLERLGRPGVHHEAHVRPIDAHPERHGGDDDVRMLVEERILVPAALVVGQAGVIGARPHSRFDQPGRERVDLPARRAVDDPGLAAMAAEDVGQLALELGAGEHAVNQVRPIERSDQLDMVAQPQLPDDVAAHARGRGGGVGVQAEVGEQAAQPPELAVLRAEIMPPLADAMRLVDRHERRRCSAPASPGSRRCPRRPAVRATRTAAGSALRAAPRRPRPCGPPPARCCSRRPPRRCRPACRPDPSSARSAARRPPPARWPSSAGAWKHSDFPAPVGMTTSESRRLTMASMASRWSGRNAV